MRRTKSQTVNDSLEVVFAQSFEARCEVENEDVVGAAPTGDASNTSEWSTIELPTQVWLILEICRYTDISGSRESQTNGEKTVIS